MKNKIREWLPKHEENKKRQHHKTHFHAKVSHFNILNHLLLHLAHFHHIYSLESLLVYAHLPVTTIRCLSSPQNLRVCHHACDTKQQQDVFSFFKTIWKNEKELIGWGLTFSALLALIIFFAHFTNMKSYKKETFETQGVFLFGCYRNATKSFSFIEIIWLRNRFFLKRILKHSTWLNESKDRVGLKILEKSFQFLYEVQTYSFFQTVAKTFH